MDADDFFTNGGMSGATGMSPFVTTQAGVWPGNAPGSDGPAADIGDPALSSGVSAGSAAAEGIRGVFAHPTGRQVIMLIALALLVFGWHAHIRSMLD